MKKISGVRKGCGETKRLYPYCGYHVQVAINVSTWELVSDYLPLNDYIRWDEGYITFATYQHPTTMKEIKADAIEALERINSERGK